MKGNAVSQRMLPYILGVGVTLIIILVVNRDYPFVGHDYRYFIPRLIDTNLHIRLNGLRIQWYTPSFGGGLPAFPNPQHLEYSFVQWFSFFMGPWPAILLTTAAVSFIGYVFFYKFLNEKLELDWKSSTLGAIFFLGNGFYIEHLIVGQLGYQLFPLGAVLLYYWFDTKNNFVINAIILAMVTSLIIYQAGFYLIIILFLSFAVTFPIIYLYRPALLDLNHIIRTVILFLPLCVMITAAKLYAVFALMSHFPRQIFDHYNVGIFQAFLGLVAQLLGVMVLAPILILGGQNTDLLSGALSNITGAVYGIWETDTGLSPVLIIILLAGVAGFLSRSRKTGIRKIETSRLRALLFLLLAVWLIMEWTFARGLIYSLIQNLPILSSLHVNVRFASAFILPLIITGTFLINRFFAEHPTSRVFVIASFCAVVSLTSYFLLSREIHSREFKLSPDSVSKETDVFPIIKIATIGDWDVFSEHASSYRPYEPLFGYSLETFKPMIHIGSVYEENNGYFNMTNPVSLVYPDINDSYPFERIKTSERGKLEVFIQHRQPDWEIPQIQKTLNIISLSTVIFCVGLILAELTLRGYAQKGIFLK